MTKIEEFYSDNYVNHTPYPGAPSTFAGHAAFLEAAAPHLEFLSNEFIDVVAGDQNACVLSKSTFRQRKTGETFEAFGFAVLRIENGKISENWGGYDPVSVFKMYEAGVRMP